MADREVQRRLAAILAADVAGYTRLMEEDSEGTVASWQDAREDVIKPVVVDHAGKVVKLTGDGFLVEFPTVQDAVKCAIGMQEGLASSTLNFRMGVNLGDIIDDGEDIHGEGVNIAARIEALADEGGINISGGVYDQIRNRIEGNYEDRGEHDVKNVSAPVRVFAIRLSDLGEAVVDVSQPIAGFDGRPAIGVLPFDNLSGDPEQEFFADGITEDIITRLSLWQWFPVIARNSTFVFKGQSVDVKEVGKKLGARYVVEGSVRKAGDRIRVAAQLIDATNGHHLWAENFDRDLTDIFAIQDEITENIVGALDPALSTAEQLRATIMPPNSLDSWEACQKAFWHTYRWSREDLEIGAQWFVKSIELDPDHPLAHGGLSMNLMRRIFRGWTDDFDATVRQMQEHGQIAIGLDDRAARGHTGLGWARMLLRQHDVALDSLNHAIEINPSFGQGYYYLGLAQAFCGLTDEARLSVDAARRLSPQDPMAPFMDDLYGLSYTLDGEFETAVSYARRAMERVPKDPIINRNLANVLGHLGRFDEAQGHWDTFERGMPEMEADRFRRSMPFKQEAHYELFTGGVELMKQHTAMETMPGTANDKPSIAVLPFDNLSGDPEQEYFSDGITEDIITALSHIRQFFVIARSSTFTFKSQAVDVQTIASELGVRYVLEGSVRKSGERVRISAQLIDGESGNHIWAERYDRNLEDIFAVQDEITLTVVGKIEPELTKAEQDRARRKPIESLAAWDYYLRGMWYLGRFSAADQREAIKMFDQAIVLDPELACAHAGLSSTHFYAFIMGTADDLLVARDQSLASAKSALELDSKDASALTAMARSLQLLGQHEEAVPYARSAVELNPSSAQAHYILGNALSFGGAPKEGIPIQEMAIRLSPHDTWSVHFMARLAEAHLFLDDIDKAIEWGEKARNQPGPYAWTGRMGLVAAYGHKGMLDEAKPAIAEMNEKRPGITLRFIDDHFPLRDEVRRNIVLDGLRKAGLPEE